MQELSYLNTQIDPIELILKKLSTVLDIPTVIEIYQKFRRKHIKSEMYSKYGKLDQINDSEDSQVYMLSDDEEVKGVR